jgi:hypothetical protein
LNFLEKNSRAKLFAEGSTPARTRLYQREISKVIQNLPGALHIRGFLRADKQGFVDFENGINYDGFLLTSKLD